MAEDAAEVLSQTWGFLSSDPIQSNLVLRLLAERAQHPEPGRYWWVTVGDEVAGVAVQSPLNLHAAITPIRTEAVATLVEATVRSAPDLPGVFGIASTASHFAGCWGERTKAAVAAVETQRLYRLGTLRPPPRVPGRLRVAAEPEGGRVFAWLRAFEEETGGFVVPPEAIKRRIKDGLVYIWHDDTPVSMASLTPISGGISAVVLVYTPPEHRGHGYGAACTAAVSQIALDAGAAHCVLFAELSNPQSNAIYRALGYERAGEHIRYRFDGR